MRIIAGEFRSRQLVTPSGPETRPTMDRARESLFNVLSNLLNFEGIFVLDLYAGSGALAFEALSRGAAKATLVDQSPNATRAIHVNAAALIVERRIVVLRQDVRRFLETSPTPFDLILMDPPYEAHETASIATLLFERDWVSSNGFCVIEHRSDTELPPIPGTHIRRELNVGEARFTILTHATPS